jgi:hypothetical protein
LFQLKQLQTYILEEVQKVYRAQGVEISDKHIELIIRQMLRRIHVVTEGDTDLLPGTEVSVSEFKRENKKAFREGKKRLRLDVQSYWVLQEHRLEVIHSYQQHHSKKQQEF